MNLGCEKTRIRLDDWLDGLLDEEVRGEVNDHLAFCDECREIFKLHLDLQGDLAALGSAAERIAASGTRVAAERHWRGMRFAGAVAAAVVVLATGYLITREDPGDVLPGNETRIAQDEGPAPELTALGDLMVRRAGSDTVQIKTGPNCMAVSVETSNPKVQLVWLYGECAPNASDESKDERTGSGTNQTRRL